MRVEKKRRSIVKATTWRVLATVDTVILSLIFTGSLKAALSIGGLEILTKIIWYYVHERLWNRIPSEYRSYPRLQRMFEHSAHTRSFIKAVSWRFFGALDTVFISLIITGKLAVSASIGGTELVTKVALYYLHERLWMHVWWGIPETQSDLSRPRSRLADVMRVLSRYYHIIAAVFYAMWCIVFILVSAYIIYGIHSLLNNG